MKRWMGWLSASVMTLALAGCSDSAEPESGAQAGIPSADGQRGAGGKADSVVGNLPIADPATAKDLFTLLEDRYPGTISFPKLLLQLRTQAEGRSVLRRFLNRLRQETGLEIAVPDFDTVLDHPETLLDQLQFTLKQIDVGRKGTLDLVGDINPPVAPDYQLPHEFNYDNLAQTTITMPPTEPKEIAEGVYTGFIRKPGVSDDFIKRNTIFSEVVERLATNTKAEQTDKFAVIYGGKRYESVQSFLDALVASGHEVTAAVNHAVANFVSMYALGPDGKRHQVAAPGFERTGIKDAQGNEAVLPFLHSEIIFTVRPGAHVQGTAVDASAVYFQGIPKTGFYCYQCVDWHEWGGSRVSDTMSGPAAIKALVLAGYFTDVARTISKKRGLAWDAYGATGVCNDSVAMVQHAVRGKVSSYPLLKLEEYMGTELDERIAELANRPQASVEKEYYQALRTAVRETPDDVTLNASARERALLSMPWEEGKEPFVSTVQARRILKGE